jgi:hypothetical protein
MNTGEEPVAVQQLGDPVGEQGHRQRDEALRRLGDAALGREPEEEDGEDGAEAEAGGDADADLHDDVVHHPVARPRPEAPGPEGGDGGVGEREGEAVVEAGLDVSAKRTSSSSPSWAGPPTCTSEASTGSVGASTAPSRSAAAGDSPTTHHRARRRRRW